MIYKDFTLILDGTPGAFTVAALQPDGATLAPVPFTLDKSDEVAATVAQIERGERPALEVARGAVHGG